MPRKCSVCTHPQAEEINKMLVEGMSLSEIVSLYSGITKTSLFRHKENHIAKTLARARDAELEASGDSLLHQVQDLQARTLAILRNAENAKEHTIALRAICEARRTLELVAKMQGELNQEMRVVVENTEVQQLINQIVFVVQSEIQDSETLERIAKRLQAGVVE